APRGRGPGLRAARDGVAHGHAEGAAREAAEELGHAVGGEVLRGVEEPGRDLQGGRVEAVALEAARDEGVVVRPDRAAVVADRGGAGLAAREGADAAAREEVLAEEALGEAGGALGRDDAAEEGVSGVRGDGGDLALLAVEGEAVEALGGHPEGGV